MSLQSTDPIAYLLTRIRNAAMVGKNEVRVPSSKLKKVVAEQLKKNGYLAEVKEEAGKPRGALVVTIAEAGSNRVKSGRGIVLVSTSKGVMTGSEAVKQKLGGELLLKVY